MVQRSTFSRAVFALLLAGAATMAHSEAAANPGQSAHTFAASGKRFLYDGKPYQIISGEMHYPRVPRAYWSDRFRKARAMGLNTITTYIFWNVHEPKPGIYDFTGQNDVAEYIREAQKEGLNVIVRPGPYVCAEWDLGGYPSWLLKDKSLILRSGDPKYLAIVRQWFARLSKELEPLLLKNGGPIIAMQVENEYGSFGDDHAYMSAMRSILAESGMAPQVLYTADGPEEIPRGSLPDLPAVINFGTGEAERGFRKLDSLRPEGPRMSGEYWAGWFDHWGEKHHTADGDKEAAELEWMLRQGYSISMYMFHGGTSFGWMNGANSNGKNYEPDTTSYDYDAPLDERGTPRTKYFSFRKVIAQVTGRELPPVPDSALARSVQVEHFEGAASLWNNLPKPVESDSLLTMEELDQAYGYVLYRTSLDAGKGGELILDGLHDYAQVYVDQHLIGSLDRRQGTSKLTLPSIAKPATLDILVENSGRVNFTSVLRGERKGILNGVKLSGQEIQHWRIYSLSMDDLSQLRFEAQSCEGPCFYRTHVNGDSPSDTWLDTRALGKGEVFVNDRPLGRFWSVGPQQSLYLPAPWLHTGQNEIEVFDLAGGPQEELKSSEAALFGAKP